MDNLKAKSISEMTGAELSLLNQQLYTELDIENLIIRAKRSGGNGTNTEYHKKINVDTTTPLNQLYVQPDIDLGIKTISEMTPDELNYVRDRLEQEERVKRHILDLKRNSGEDWNWDSRPAISSEVPVNSLYHHGILGQKWGVRRDRRSLVKKSTSSKTSGKASETKDDKPKSEDYMESRILKSKASSGLSNTELKKLNDRLNLEKQYKDLTKDSGQKGKSFIDKAITSGLDQTMSSVVAAGSLYAVKKLIEKTMGSAAASEMFPSSKKK